MCLRWSSGFICVARQVDGVLNLPSRAQVFALISSETKADLELKWWEVAAPGVRHVCEARTSPAFVASQLSLSAAVCLLPDGPSQGTSQSHETCRIGAE